MQPQLFNFKGQQVRTVTINGEPCFVGNDVSTILGYSNYRNAVVNHVDDEDKQRTQIEYAGQKREVTVINESGLYSLILGSKLPQAKEFKHWVTSEVLPTIRKHGAYMTPAKIEEVLTDPDTIIQLATQLKEEQQKRKRLQEENEVMKPKALFADAVSTAKTNILIGEMAKILKANGVDYITVAGQKVTMGQNHFFQWLRENGYLIKRRGTDYNAPTQMAMNKGLFKVKESTSIDANGTTRVNKTTKVTGKGQQYFTNYFLAA
ncbi:phage antirepressor [Limosilactobacillus coleohominis]|uniref:phage antirepressor n=1 Tax=Limosilactobacillus coleohominis TaxID=181675 RepID=UPI0026F199CA|nr:phage antirepressor [Limosilactobacillus coleohominis]